MSSRLRYTTSGPVDGACGHSHPSMISAHNCITRFMKIPVARNFTDRTVKRLNGKKEELLGVEEVIQLQKEAEK